MLRAHPKLLVFPFIGALSGIAFIATLFGSLYLTGPSSKTLGLLCTSPALLKSAIVNIE